MSNDSVTASGTALGYAVVRVRSETSWENNHFCIVWLRSRPSTCPHSPLRSPRAVSFKKGLDCNRPQLRDSWRYICFCFQSIVSIFQLSYLLLTPGNEKYTYLLIFHWEFQLSFVYSITRKGFTFPSLTRTSVGFGLALFSQSCSDTLLSRSPCKKLYLNRQICGFSVP